MPTSSRATQGDNIITFRVLFTDLKTNLKCLSVLKSKKNPTDHLIHIPGRSREFFADLRRSATRGYNDSGDSQVLGFFRTYGWVKEINANTLQITDLGNNLLSVFDSSSNNITYNDVYYENIINSLLFWKHNPKKAGKTIANVSVGYILLKLLTEDRIGKYITAEELAWLFRERKATCDADLESIITFIQNYRDGKEHLPASLKIDKRIFTAFNTWKIFNLDGKGRKTKLFLKGELIDMVNKKLASFTPTTGDEISNKGLGKDGPKTNISHIPLNMILYGPPGTGKTYETACYAVAIIENKDLDIIKNEDRGKMYLRYEKYVKDGRIKFTTFHQSYSYETFIEGFKPGVNASKQLYFDSYTGVFKEIADKAEKARKKKKNYVIIIDEINRGNISKVFGELITLIEEDKRWGNPNKISAVLPSGKTLRIPNNLYIIGTMNSADKSISLIDVALRRRFCFIEIPPNEKCVKPEYLDFFRTLNTKLFDEKKSTDLLIGHAYFMNESSLKDVLNQQIIPLLYEYLMDDRDKVSEILRDCIGKLDKTRFKLNVVDNKTNKRVYIE